MSKRAWIEMPLVRSKSDDDRLEPKYAISGRVVVVHHQGKAYVTFEDRTAQREIERHADCRQLSASEAQSFEQALPFPLPPELFVADGGGSRRGLGDLVSWLLHLVGLRECPTCQQRKRRLNQFMGWGWSRR